MQCAIDNAKRTFDIDLVKEIDDIRKGMDIDNNRYPIFWKSIKDSKIKDSAKKFKKEKLNYDLNCPMNYLANLKLEKFRDSNSTLPMDYFFVDYELTNDEKRRSKKVEELIEKYSLDLHNTTIYEDDDDEAHFDYLIYGDEFDQLIEDIKKTYISKNYIGLTAYLINRAFLITGNAKMGASRSNNKTNKNKSLLLKVLYDINPDNVLKCFSKNINFC